MEKRKPHHSLDAIKAVFCTPEKLNITKTARNCARSLGINLDQVVAIVQSLSAKNFYKSMTSDLNSSIWQDVYHVAHGKTELYVKFTTDSRGYLLISLKEK